MANKGPILSEASVMLKYFSLSFNGTMSLVTRRARTIIPPLPMPRIHRPTSSSVTLSALQQKIVPAVNNATAVSNNR